MTQKQYPFRYNLDSDVDSWLQAQKNKRESIEMLISAAVKAYGYQDLRNIVAGRLSLDESETNSVSGSNEVKAYPKQPIRKTKTKTRDNAETSPSDTGNVFDMLSSL